jgi:hypothetical protein
MQLEVKHLAIILLILALIFFPLGLAHAIVAIFHGLGVVLTGLFHGGNTT